MSEKKHIEYAVVDIETTGGAVRHSRMTEIAIRIFDGTTITERYETLIDPQQPIPPAITALTGISDAMVAGRPVFQEIATQVFSMLQNRVFVAHNVNFDYSFVKQQLLESGMNFSARRLCTVRLARKVHPGLRSYSLGRLCEHFSIPNAARHRAAGDAEATTQLLSLLLMRDNRGHAALMLNQRSGEQKLPPHLDIREFEALPGKPGVYYFMDKQGKVVYVGKAVDLKKRVASHFTGHNPTTQRQLFLKEIHHIGYELCGNELMALLLECQEIKRLWPRFNKALKEIEFKYGLYAYEDQSGYMRLGIGKRLKYIPCVQSFDRLSEAAKTLRELRDGFALDPARCIFNGSMVSRSVGQSPATVPVSEPPASYNKRVGLALASLKTDFPSYLVLDRGRTGEEQSCIWVERGHLRAMGYISQASDLTRWEQIRDTLKPCSSNPYMMILIRDYIQKHPEKVQQLPEADPELTA